MFAHEVIEHMKQPSEIVSSWGREYLRKICHVQADIKSSQKFHVGTFDSLLEINLPNKGKRMFSGDMGDVRLPFSLCWFDFLMTNWDQSVPENTRYSKSGILVKEFAPNLLFVNIFCLFPTLKKWVMAPQGYFVSIDNHAQSSEDGNIRPLPYVANTPIKQFTQEDANQLDVLNISLLLLGCKNINIMNQEPQEKLNKKRIKRGKQPLFTYHTLSLNPVGKAQESIPKHLWENRIHLARGHFKTFTPEKPLFGRITGRFWWQPQVRGRNRNGVVMKDYAIDANDFESIG